MHAQYWGDHSNCQKTINLLKLLDMASVSSGIPEMQFVLSNSE